MANGKSGRILDQDFEKGIRKGAQDNIDSAQGYAYRKNDEVEGMIKDHPKAFVIGAFIGGFALGTLLSKGK